MERDGTAVVTARVVEPVEIVGDFWRAREAFGDTLTFLLDSSSPSDGLGRYSFLGGDPFLVLRAWRKGSSDGGNGSVQRVDVLRDVGLAAWPVGSTHEWRGDFYAGLRGILGAFATPRPTDAIAPFLGGAVGYLAYEAGHFSEHYSDSACDDLDVPDAYLLFVDAVVAHDHQSGASFVATIGWGSTADEAKRRAAQRAAAVTHRLRTRTLSPRPGCSPAGAHQSELVIESYVNAHDYVRLVDAVKEELRAGNAYEVCLTHRLEVRTAVSDPWRLYGELRGVNPAPFASFLSFPELSVMSSSPERFLRLGDDRVAESRPIKGTRPRGRDAVEDDALARELASNVKDRAENVMIVDLVRNDLGRVCRPGSVHATELLVVEPYATVFQLVSTVVGELEDPNDGLDLVRACFPGGSMTGAPKIAAMNIIDGLEPFTRGVYSGAIGYFDFGGTLDLSITIRTFVIVDGRCTFSVGGAIVMNSDPLAEYAESMDKARALCTALQRFAGANRIELRHAGPKTADPVAPAATADRAPAFV